jgi:hypothetical protein
MEGFSVFGRWGNAVIDFSCSGMLVSKPGLNRREQTVDLISRNALASGFRCKTQQF